MHYDWALVGSVFPFDFSVELEQRSHVVWHIVVWPGCELVVSEVVDMAGAETRLERV